MENVENRVSQSYSQIQHLVTPFEVKRPSRKYTAFRVISLLSYRFLRKHSDYSDDSEVGRRRSSSGNSAFPSLDRTKDGKPKSRTQNRPKVDSRYSIVSYASMTAVKIFRSIHIILISKFLQTVQIECPGNESPLSHSGFEIREFPFPLLVL